MKIQEKAALILQYSAAALACSFGERSHRQHPAENGRIPGLLVRPHNQLRSKPLVIPCPPTPWTWTRVVAGSCPTSVPGQGHQWLLPTHGPRVASVQRPVCARNQNKGNVVQLCLLKEDLLLQSSYFCQICVRPLITEVSQVYFIILYCSLFPPSFFKLKSQATT